MVNHRRLGPGDEDRGGRTRHAGVHAFPRRRRSVHPVQRDDEERPGGQIRDLADGGDHVRLTFVGRSPVLNSFSIRSVIRKPLTMFVIEAKSATAPRVRIAGGASPPPTRIAPTTAMADIAFVIDISGVWRSRDTRRITPRPTNDASRNTQTVAQTSVMPYLHRASATCAPPWAGADRRKHRRFRRLFAHTDAPLFTKTRSRPLRP